MIDWFGDKAAKRRAAAAEKRRQGTLEWFNLYYPDADMGQVSDFLSQHPGTRINDLLEMSSVFRQDALEREKIEAIEARHQRMEATRCWTCRFFVGYECFKDPPVPVNPMIEGHRGYIEGAGRS